jgi:hypothetical protein
VGSDQRKRLVDNPSRPQASLRVLSRPARPGVGRRESGGKTWRRPDQNSAPIWGHAEGLEFESVRPSGLLRLPECPRWGCNTRVREVVQGPGVLSICSKCLTRHSQVLDVLAWSNAITQVPQARSVIGQSRTNLENAGALRGRWSWILGVDSC